MAGTAGTPVKSIVSTAQHGARPLQVKLTLSGLHVHNPKMHLQNDV